MKLTVVKILIVFFLVHLTFSSHAQSRDIAVLWDSSESEMESYTFSLTHRKLEVILNHYGFKAHYFDINLKSFDSSDVKPTEYYALLTWFSDEEARNYKALRQTFKNWFLSKKKVLSLGQLGFFFDEKGESYNLKEINEILKLVDIAYEDHSYESPLGLKLVSNTEKKNIEFERDLKFEIPAVKVFKSLSDKNTIWASVEDTINKKVSPVVLFNNRFFMVHSGFDIFYHPQRHFTQWRINPFEIVSWLRSDPLMPVPDTTTINGKRIYYAHIDGDAFINISDIDQVNISGSVLVSEVLDKYKLPVTSSYVVAELDPVYLGKPNYIEVAKNIAKLNYVEIASHTYFHPLSWNKKPPQYEIDAYLDDPKQYKGGPILAYWPKDRELNYKREIIDSIDYINQKIAPKGKETKFLLWSGSCEPPEEALKIIHDNGYINLNGGDSRFDRSFPSYSHLQPLYRKVGKYIQYYSSNANEIPYTANWTGPFSGYEKVIETYDNAEAPVRIKPINAYYHFYSGEKRSSINALKRIYDWTITQDILPIFASEYPAIIQGFIDSKILKSKELTYKLNNYGTLRTFRIDSKLYTVDLKQSKNIIGQRLINDSLYIFLGEDKSAKIVLQQNDSKLPFLESSHYRFSEFFVSKNSIKIKGSSLWGRSIVLNTAGKVVRANEAYASIEQAGSIAKVTFRSAKIETTIEFEP